MQRISVLTEYIDEALRLANYEIIENKDEPYYGEIDALEGVWATGKTLKECEYNLKEALESWLLFSMKHNMAIPSLNGRKIELLEEYA